MPTTAPNSDEESTVAPNPQNAKERANDVQNEILVMPPTTNPPLPFILWPTPPKDLETL